MVLCSTSYVHRRKSFFQETRLFLSDRGTYGRPWLWSSALPISGGERETHRERADKGRPSLSHSCVLICRQSQELTVSQSMCMLSCSKNKPEDDRRNQVSWSLNSLIDKLLTSKQATWLCLALLWQLWKTAKTSKKASVGIGIFFFSISTPICSLNLKPLVILLLSWNEN